jgi:hypothetical protein
MTKDEIKIVTFVLLALVVGAATKSYRDSHPESPKSTPLPKYRSVRSAKPRVSVPDFRSVEQRRE